ncbi:Restriction of telomere capping protein 5 [Entomophthora muscae]|uniref:Restriction of telomere capping protein 5 n=1 Tax=Entomophthora muscae TaxID=34485 RepID=A0ACC2TX00_9FUNG|nr:Restriction of telomere capping protein 5 [Entomophthora muscae]
MGASQSQESSNSKVESGSNSESEVPSFSALAQKSGLDEEFVRRLYSAIPKLKLSKDDFLEALNSPSSGISCEEIFLEMIWGLPSPDSLLDNSAEEVRSFEEILVSFGVLSGDYPKKLIESPTVSAFTSLSTIESSDEDAEAEISQVKVNSLLSFLFKVFRNYELSEHSAHQLTYPFPQKSLKMTIQSTIVLFRFSKSRPAWEVGSEFNLTFPGWLDLISYYLTKETFLSSIEAPLQHFPLFEIAPKILSEESFFHLALALSTSKGGNASVWDRLYLASDDGFSMNRFETKTFKYSGPTLTLIQGVVESTEIVLAIYIEDAWQKSKLTWGGKATRVFEVMPFFEAFVPLKEGLICYNSSCGIGVGPTAQAARLTPEGFLLRVDSSFQTAYYSAWSPYPERPSFKPSRFRSSTPSPFRSGEVAAIEVLEIEVIGLGGSKALIRQKADWQFEANDIERRANIAAFQNPHDPANRQILEMAGIVSEDVSIHRSS